jgi:GcrA cell cycle regulator
MSWTDDRVEILKKLWSEGLSASQIAMRLGTVTRNAVIGKVHRLGLAGRATTTRVKPVRAPARVVPGNTKRPQARTRAVPVPVSTAPEAVFEPVYEPLPAEREEVYIPPHERKGVLELLESHCRWPIGDPQMHDFHFCGHPKVPGLPYCEAHAKRAYQPDLPRRRDRLGGPLGRPVELVRAAVSDTPTTRPRSNSEGEDN